MMEKQDYISRFILDHDLAMTIDDNIIFVEKYLDQVESNYPDKKEQEIIYKHLGAIVYSCIEATWKFVIYEINKHCELRQCKRKKCWYRLNNNLDYLSAKGAFYFLLDTRFFGFTINDINRISYLADLRNYIHLSKYIGEKDNHDDFKKEYVGELLGYYYKIIKQLNTADWFFEKDNSCLKYLDSNGFEDTNKQRKNDSNYYFFYSFLLVIDKLFDKEELIKEDKWIISNIKNDNMDDNCIRNIIDHIAYKRRLYKTDEEYNKAIKHFYDILIKNKQGKLQERIEQKISDKLSFKN